MAGRWGMVYIELPGGAGKRKLGDPILSATLRIMRAGHTGGVVIGMSLLSHRHGAVLKEAAVKEPIITCNLKTSQRDTRWLIGSEDVGVLTTLAEDLLHTSLQRNLADSREVDEEMLASAATTYAYEVGEHLPIPPIDEGLADSARWRLLFSWKWRAKEHISMLELNARATLRAGGLGFYSLWILKCPWAPQRGVGAAGQA